MGSVLRDMVHGYIELSPIEEAILDRPVVQRLHRITQNGLAYLTYPCNRTSRFAHSLGAMHVAGSFFRTAILHGFEAGGSSEQLIAKFKVRLLAESSRRGMGNWDTQELRSQGNRGFWARLGFNDGVHTVVWQAVRLACLLHDLGHLPFSHTSEAVLQALARKVEPIEAILVSLQRNVGVGERPIHELIGVSLAREVLEPLQNELAQPNWNLLYMRSLQLASRILQEDSSEITTLGALHRIIDGEVDADRADYVLRDSIASGIPEVGLFDLHRIIQEQQLDYERAYGFQIRASSKAMHAVEGFCLARFRMWRALVFHTNVVRSEMAVSRLLYLFGRLFFANLEDVPNLPKEAAELIKQSELSALWTFLRADNSKIDLHHLEAQDETLMFRSFRKLLSGLEPFWGHGNEWLRELVVFLRFVVQRDKKRIKPLWKRVDQYRDFAIQYLKGLTSKARREIAAELGLSKPQDSPALSMNWHIKNRIGQLVSKDEDPIGTGVRLEARLTEKLHKPNLKVRLSFHMDLSPRLKSYRVSTAAGSSSVEELSPIIQASERAWQSDVQFHGFVVLIDGDDPEKASKARLTYAALGPVLAQSVEALSAEELR